MDNNLPPSSSSALSYPQTVSFKPASGSHVSLTDLMDLNELFAEDFEMPTYNYDEYAANLPQGLELDEFVGLTPSYDQISLSSLSPNFTFSSFLGTSIHDKLNDKMVKGKHDVIMIPPTMPRSNMPIVPNVKSEGTKSKSKGTPSQDKGVLGKRSLDAAEDSKVPKGAKSAEMRPGADDGDQTEFLKVERRYI